MTFAMLVMWVLAGVVAGGLAALVLQRGGYGRMIDIALGLGGAFVGTVVFRILGIVPDAGLVAMTVVALAGAASSSWRSRATGTLRFLKGSRAC